MNAPVFWADADGEHFWFSHQCIAHGRQLTDTSLMPHSGGTWHIVSNETDPMTVVPSIHCDVSKGGCGLHGWITDGKWVSV